MVLDRHVLALDVARFIEAFAERGHITHYAIGRPAADEPASMAAVRAPQAATQPRRREA